MLYANSAIQSNIMANRGDSMTALNGRRLKRAREKNELTLREAGQVLGVSAGYLSDFENGNKNPGVLTLIKGMARLYGVSADWLLGLDGDGAEDALSVHDRVIVNMLEEIMRATRHKKLSDLLDSGSPAFARAVDELLEIDEVDVSVEVMDEPSFA